MRTRAFTLVEMLVVITVLPFVAIAFSSLFATFIRDVPRMTRMVQENTSVLDLVRHIRDDVDAAVGLPDAFGGTKSDDHTLLIALPKTVICYRIQGAGVTRTVLGGEQTEPRAEGTWRFRDAVIGWRLWGRSDSANAVELRTFLRERISGRIREKLANSYLYFVGGLAREETP
jgi:prepilin-type N-terminal cleavage/methylation domain-containing protein